MIKKEYTNQFLLGPYQLWTYNIPYAHRHQAGEIKKRLILIFDRGYDLDELEQDPTLPSHICPYFAFFTSNKNAKSIKPNIFIDGVHLDDFHLKHPSTLNIRDGFLSSKDNTITVEDIEKNGNFIAELSETAINYLLQFSSFIKKWESFKLMSLNDFKEHKLQDQKWIQDNIINEQMSLKESNNSKTNIELIDDLIEDIYNLRKQGMARDGEMDIFNLIFKEFRNLGYLDNLKELKKQEISKELSLEQLQEHILLETKQDIEAFIDKFGQDTYDEFKKSSQRLKNSGYSTDIIKYTKDDSWTKEKLDKLLFNLSNKLVVSKDDSTKIEGKYRDLGVQGNYHIYEPLDALASMNLGVGSGWCTAGRYEHYGDKNFKSSLKDAKKHWDKYTSQGVRFFYYLDKDTNLAKYAVAVYPKLLEVDILIGGNFISKTNFEIYNAADELDYSAFNKLPTNNLGVELTWEIKMVDNNIIYTLENGAKTKFAEIKNGTLYVEDGVKEIGTLSDILPEDKLNKIKNIILPDSVEEIESGTFVYWFSLESITMTNSVKFIGSSAFSNCESLKSITIPNSVEEIGQNAFYGCPNLTIYCETESQPKGWDKDWNPYNRPVVWGYKKQR